jgi:hypothetical protein
VAFGAAVTSCAHGPGLFTHCALNGGCRNRHAVWLTTVRVGPGHPGTPGPSPHFTRELNTMKPPSP